jgi:excinuclease UvrABC ATPase subunit
LRDEPREPTGAVKIEDASTHNLKHVSVDIPLGVLTAITGVAGAGKSSLIQGSVAGREGVAIVDQAAIRGSRRSNPATYSGLLDPVRKAFAKANGVKPALFSANSEGACPNCKGIGLIYTELGVMNEVATVCEECEGKRFTPEVLEYKLHGKDISEVLAMTVSEARDLFTEGQAAAILERLAAVGLDYLALGQPLTTLSAGERQRLKLAIQMAEAATVYVLDEPTTGLHLADIDRLLALLDRLVDDGNTVIVIEHHLAVMAHADWLIDLGPGAGHDGGEIVFTGTPAELVATGSSLTAEHLREYVGGKRRPARRGGRSKRAAVA